MKKHLLIGSALLVAISAYPQSGKMVKPSGILQITPKKVYTEVDASQHQATVINGPVKKSLKAVNGNAKISSNPINRFTGSMNVFGYLVSHSKPLQYNAGVNAVSMVARKDGTYTASANSNSGTQVGHYTTDMGNTWNETCIWANATNLARYPQGGIYNPLGNTNINNAYIVGTGPITTTGWVGNWYASKQITTPGNTTPGADQQSMMNASLPPTMRVHHMSRYAFTAIDGGLVRSMAEIMNDPSATTFAAAGTRGAGMIKGLFSAGAFVWSIDSFIPPTTMNSGGWKNLDGLPFQAWNENGTIGYVIMLGSRASETLSPTRVSKTGGMQPIVYKTTNSGASWSLLPAYDFADPACFKGVYDRTYPVKTNTALIVANFQQTEGWDAVVDANGQLHIGSMVLGHSSNHVDSLGYRNVFGTEQYNYAETGPFNYPVFYDFYTYAAGGWGYHMIDSMGTEGPSGTSGQPGYGSNNWSDGSGGKMALDARFQMSRSVDGTKIFYTWTESDSTITGAKWNIFPDLKVKGYDVTTKMVTGRLDVTNTSTLTQSAYYHYTSNKAAVSAGTYTVPTTITKNATLDGSVNVDTYFNNNAVFASSSFSINAMSPKNGCTVTAISNQTVYNYEVSAYPNPANQQTTVVVRLKEKASNIEVTILNSIGQLVNTYHVNGQMGVNEINVDLNNLSSGVYFYNVKVDNATITKKLIVQ